MKISTTFLSFAAVIISCSGFAQQIILIRDSIMDERMKSGYATKHFAPKGAYDAQKERTGFWKDYEAKYEGSFQEADGEPMKTFGHYLLYGEGRFEAGQRVGDWRIYVVENKTDKKILCEQLQYVNGTAEGAFIYFYPNGEKAQDGDYENGKMEGAVTIYYTGGAVFGKQFYVKGNRQGEQNYFYRSGKPYYTVVYENGKREGEYHQWYENGNLKESFRYKGDSTDGVYRYYYPDGKLWTESQYDKGRLSNVTALYDKNGKELYKGDLKDGNGAVNYYDENGNVYEKTTFKDGIGIKSEKIRSVKFK